MKKIAVVLVWVLAAVLLIAVSITAVSDRLSLIPVSEEDITTSTTAPSVVLVNLNTATSEELQQLDGLGEVLAQRIIAYRDLHGSFRSADDLLDIEGIGQKRLEQWRSQLTI